MSNKSHNVHNDDLIELKKMRQGLIDTPTISNEPKPKLTGWPAFANFIQYNKFYILAGLAIILAITLFVRSCITKIEPDCLVVANIGSYGLDTVTESYSQIFSEICSDTNGDGTPLVSVVDCSYNEETTDAQKLTTNIMKFQTQFSINYAQLFILNYDNMVKLENISDGDLWVDDLDLKEYNGKAIKLNGTKFEQIYREKTGVGFNEDLYLCMRKSNKKITKSKDGKSAIKAAREIMTNLNNQIQ